MQKGLRNGFRRPFVSERHPVPIRDRSGFTLIELLIVVAIIAIIAAIAIPGLLRARISANEAAAIASLRSINSSQHAYSSSCARGSFATVLTDLAISPSPNSPPFISTDLGVAAPSVIKSGYVIEMHGGTDGMPAHDDACNGVAAADLSSSYYAFADPVTVNSSGTRYFWTNTIATIYFNAAGTMSGQKNGSSPPSIGAIVQ